MKKACAVSIKSEH